MSRVLAIDPGRERSAWIALREDGTPVDMSIDENPEILPLLEGWRARDGGPVVLEALSCYGARVGRDVFETAYWIGRFDPDATAVLLERREVRMHLCGTARAGDAEIRAVLLDRYGPGKDLAVGRKAKPGPLYGVKTHIWSALAVGVTYLDRMKETV